MDSFFQSYQFLNTIGLSIDIIGVLVLFYTGLPFKLPEKEMLFEEKLTSNQKKKNKTQAYWAYFGLSLLIIGFGVQILGTIISFQ